MSNTQYSKLEEIKATLIKNIMEADPSTLTEPRILNFRVSQYVKQLYDNLSRRKKKIVKQVLIETIKALAGLPTEPKDSQPIMINMNVNVNEVKPTIKNENKVVFITYKLVKKVQSELKGILLLLEHPSPVNIKSAVKKIELMIEQLNEEKVKLLDKVDEA